MSDVVVEIPTASNVARKVFGDLSFDLVRKGYDPFQIDAFVERASRELDEAKDRLAQVEPTARYTQALIAEAEKRVREAEARATDAEGERGVLRRTIKLAEQTAADAVADARAQAAKILAEGRQQGEEMVAEARRQVTEMFTDERRQIGEARAVLEGETAQLETLRLALAAETMALEEVRGDLRDRVATMASELHALADGTDLLDYQISRRTATAVAAPAVSSAEPAATRPNPAVPPPESIPVPDPHGPAAAPPQPAPEPAPLPAAAEIQTDEASVDVDEAFAQFFSDEVEQEPSQAWMLAD